MNVSQFSLNYCTHTSSQNGVIKVHNSKNFVITSGLILQCFNDLNEDKLEEYSEYVNDISRLKRSYVKSIPVVTWPPLAGEY